MNEKEIIMELILAGEDLEEAAQKCSYDKELKEWESVKKKALKLIGGKNAIKDFFTKKQAILEEARKQKYEKEEAKLNAQRAAEQEALRKELGY